MLSLQEKYNPHQAESVLIVGELVLICIGIVLLAVSVMLCMNVYNIRSHMRLEEDKQVVRTVAALCENLK